ncbi:MAG: hypothetical protein ACI4HI_12365 [Lachnospiraceae bacterium]
MKTLYLHIGLHKTGTTAIQRFLAANTEYLESQSYCFKLVPLSYPRASKYRNAHFINAKMYDENGNFDPALTRERQEAGMKLVLEWFETYDNVILSDEGIWVSTGRKDANAFDVALEYAKKYNFQLKVIVYLRRQDELICSWWKQRVRTGMRYDDWETVMADLPSYFKMDYEKGLKLLEQKVGPDAVIVRRYDPKRFSGPGNTIYSDFLESIGLEYNDRYVIPTDLVNPSFPDSYTEIKRILNDLNTPESSFNDADILYLEKLCERCTIELEHERTSFFSKEEHIAFLKKYEKSNAAVAKKYFNSDEPLFTENFKDLPKFDPNSYTHQEEIIRFFGAACLQQEKELSALRQDVKALKKQVDAHTRKLKPHIPGLWRVRRFFRNLFKK